ncbi:MAG: glycine cleavage system protein GcvH [Acidobacteria bacterium]|nr:glycine cleavage system protein GcvH [Acidobacteriota bacterium]
MYPSDLKYTKDHEWVRIEDGHGTVGITNFAQQQLGDVVFVELPEVGTALTLGQPFGTIESVKAVSELFAPLTGTVTEVNTAIKDRPDAVNSAPHDTWMIKVQLANPAEADALLAAADYEASLAP